MTVLIVPICLIAHTVWQLFWAVLLRQRNAKEYDEDRKKIRRENMAATKSQSAGNLELKEFRDLKNLKEKELRT